MSAIENIRLLDHGVLRFVTAGSVDDGKSTLIGRLLYDTKAILADQLASIKLTSERRGQALDLSLLTDGLVAEREQGITIDVAYRYFATALRKFIVADAPGHEQYTRNMVTAASTADLAILLVDARSGVVTQTRRHAMLAHLLGVRNVVLAVNKMDLVDFDQTVFDTIVEEFRAFALNAGIGTVAPVPMSALTGDMVVDRGDRLAWYRGPTLLQILETAEVQPTLAQSAFRFPVQYVARPTASIPRGYMGRVESGSIAVGDAVTVLPSGRPSRVKQILTYDGKHEAAVQNDSITVILEDEIDVSRGDMITRASAPAHVASVLDATVCWFAAEALDVRRKYVVRHTTREVRGMVAGIDHLWNPSTQSRERAPASLRTNDIGQIQIRLAQPLCVDPYDDNRTTGSFILIDENTNNTVAAGMIQ
jgi:sulfate adenylyltransferase subunit 1